MYNKLEFKSLLIYSNKHDKCFFTDFGEGVNLVVGCNTSGKSTVFQSVLYALGINEYKMKLKSLLDEDVVFRLNCKVSTGSLTDSITFIREGATLIVEHKNTTYRFNSIDGNSSNEHIKLKNYFSKLFGFNLILESKGKRNEAPMETLFLPYYISQSVGWVYLRKSFSNLEFYKSFKEYYLDYFLGISSGEDNTEKYRLLLLLKEKNGQIEALEKLENEDNKVKVSQMVDEKFKSKSKDYLETFNNKSSQLRKLEKEYTQLCNELSYSIQRKSVVSKIERNLKKQSPIDGCCPTCDREYPVDLKANYRFYQELNDTSSQKEKIKEKIKSVQGSLGTKKKKIDALRIEIESDYSLLDQYDNYEVSFSNWIDVKANIKYADNVDKRLDKLKDEKNQILEALSTFKSSAEIDEQRKAQSIRFRGKFQKYLNELKVEKNEYDSYHDLYKITSFASQGVELHKTVMAYHFAFNHLIKDTPGIHRFPFVLDAIFKEDIEEDNKHRILKFISQHQPEDTQTMISVAVSKDTEKIIKEYSEMFSGNMKLIKVGDLVKQKSLLSMDSSDYDHIIEDTFSIVNG